MTRAVAAHSLLNIFSTLCRALVVAALCAPFAWPRAARAQAAAGPSRSPGAERQEQTPNASAGASTAEGQELATDPSTAAPADAGLPATPDPPTTADVPPSRREPRVTWTGGPSPDEPAHSGGTGEPGELDEAGESKRAKRWLLYLVPSAESLGGDFDDSTVIVQQQPGYAPAFTLLPNLDMGWGFSLGVSYGALPHRIGATGFSAGVSYSIAWFGGSSEHTRAAPSASLHAIETPLRITYRAWRRVMPYAHLTYGLGILGLTGTHGSGSSASSFDGTTALLLGHHLSFGLGALVTLGEHLAIDASLSCRTLIPTSIDGFGINGTVIGVGWMLRVGPALSF